MKTPQLILVCLMILMLVACNTEQTIPVVDHLDIELVVMPDPPTTGDATLMIMVKDRDDKPIDDATVTVLGNMDHEGMASVEGKSTSVQNGVYQVPLEWTMGGGWILDVTVTLSDNAGIATEQFEFYVGAISQDSIINQNNNDTDGMDHNEMENDEMTTVSDHSD